LSNRDPALGMTFGILRCEVMELEIRQIKEGSLKIDSDVCQIFVDLLAMFYRDQGVWQCLLYQALGVVLYNGMCKPLMALSEHEVLVHTGEFLTLILVLHMMTISIGHERCTFDRQASCTSRRVQRNPLYLRYRNTGATGYKADVASVLIIDYRVGKKRVRVVNRGF